MRLNAQLFARGTKVAAASASGYEAALGYQDDLPNGESWRLVKAKTAITAPAKKLLRFVVTAGAISWSVAPTSTAGDLQVAGVGDPDLSGDVAAGDLLWVQRRGEPEIKSVTGLAAGEVVTSVTTTAGSVGELALNAATGAVVNQMRGIGIALSAHSTTTSTAKVRLTNIH